jgi:hypothetical protein
MKLFKSLLLSVLFVAAISFTGCNEEPVTSSPTAKTPTLSKLTLPAGAVITSATFNIYVEDPYNHDITTHQVNVPWVEATETWNIFFGKPAEQFEAASLGGFNAGTSGWKTVDILALVQAWVNGTTDNNGVLLNQPVVGGWLNNYRSKEAGDGSSAPYLEVTYTHNGTSHTDQEPAFMDTWISSISPDTPYGSDALLLNGRPETNYIKYVLVQFDIEGTPVQNCETAYAYGEGASLQTLCFLDIPNVQGENWGWTNQIAPGTYNWPIYAGAGRCDITKGTLVGNLNVVYAGGTATITFQPNAGVTLGDTHVWVGTNGNMLPYARGKYITAPGQFNYNDMNPVVATGLTGNIWIAAHSGEACW